MKVRFFLWFFHGRLTEAVKCMSKYQVLNRSNEGLSLGYFGKSAEVHCLICGKFAAYNK